MTVLAVSRGRTKTTELYVCQSFLGLSGLVCSFVTISGQPPSLFSQTEGLKSNQEEEKNSANLNGKTDTTGILLEKHLVKL